MKCFVYKFENQNLSLVFMEGVGYCGVFNFSVVVEIGFLKFIVSQFSLFVE